jgi:hypothetical protein
MFFAWILHLLLCAGLRVHALSIRIGLKYTYTL